MKVLITGGAGFIGSHIAEGLVRGLHGAQGAFEIRVLDDLSSGRDSNLAAIPAKVDFRKGDIRDPDVVAKAMEGVSFVFHHAAMVSVHKSVAEPGLCNDVNVNGTLNLLAAARAAGVKKFLFASSSAVYGENPISPKTEDLLPDPISPYAVSKLTGEYYCKMYSRLYDLHTVCFRYFNVFGPRQDPKSQYAAVIPKFVEAIRSGAGVQIFGDGEQTRDFVFVQDVAQANIKAALGKTEPGSVFNVGRGEKLSLNELVRLLSKLLGREVSKRHTDPVAGDIKHSLADVSAVKRALGFKPGVTIEQGLIALLQERGIPLAKAAG